LKQGTPEPRPLQLIDVARIVPTPEASGLHHRYERCAAQ